MTTPSNGEEHVQLQLGLYVLDALSPDEFAAVESHLATCAECRTEAFELGEVRDFLDLLTLADVDAIQAERMTADALAPGPALPVTPPAPVRSRPQPRSAATAPPNAATAPTAPPGATPPPVTTNRRRPSGTGPPGRPGPRRRPAHPYSLILSAVALALVVGVGIGVWLNTSSPVGVTLAGNETNAVTGVSLSVTVVGTDGNSHVDAEVKGLKPGVTYQLYAVSTRGGTQVVTRWVASGPTQTVAGDIATRAEDLAFVTVTQADGSVLITVRVTQSGGTK